jgi:hypothetical protein
LSDVPLEEDGIGRVTPIGSKKDLWVEVDRLPIRRRGVGQRFRYASPRDVESG